MTAEAGALSTARLPPLANGTTQVDTANGSGRAARHLPSVHDEGVVAVGGQFEIDLLVGASVGARGDGVAGRVEQVQVDVGVTRDHQRDAGERRARQR